ncbi:MAG: hypothetical protein ACLR8P_15385 [Clostridium fessum]
MSQNVFLADAEQFDATRNMYGYTGYYQGKRVSVMGISAWAVRRWNLFL